MKSERIPKHHGRSYRITLVLDIRDPLEKATYDYLQRAPHGGVTARLKKLVREGMVQHRKKYAGGNDE